MRVADTEYVVCSTMFAVAGQFVIQRGDNEYLELHALDESTPPILGNMTANPVICLAYGDQIRTSLQGDMVLEVLPR